MNNEKERESPIIYLSEAGKLLAEYLKNDWDQRVKALGDKIVADMKNEHTPLPIPKSKGRNHIDRADPASFTNDQLIAIMKLDCFPIGYSKIFDKAAAELDRRLTPNT